MNKSNSIRENPICYAPEQEAYFRLLREKRERRAEWWDDNGYKFFYYPLCAVGVAACLLFVCILSVEPIADAALYLRKEIAGERRSILQKHEIEALVDNKINESEARRFFSAPIRFMTTTNYSPFTNLATGDVFKFPTD